MNNEEQELKPCPFCGGEAELEHVVMQFDYAPFEVYCKNCGAKRTDYNRGDAIEGWNSRADGETGNKEEVAE